MELPEDLKDISIDLEFDLEDWFIEYILSEDEIVYLLL